MMGAFGVAEVVQVISGSSTVMWDPSGQHLTRSVQEEMGAGGRGRTAAFVPKAKQYK